MQMTNSCVSTYVEVPKSVEGYCGGLCLYPECFLPAVGCSSWGIDLAMHVLGKFIKGLVVFSTT